MVPVFSRARWCLLIIDAWEVLNTTTKRDFPRRLQISSASFNGGWAAGLATASVNFEFNFYDNLEMNSLMHFPSDPCGCMVNALVD